MKKIKSALAIIALGVTLVGCGQPVEVAPASVGKVMGKNGYKEGIIPTSKFRLDMCWAYCDKLVTLSASDFSVKESMKLFMPKDKLELTFDIRTTLAVDPADYEQLFAKITPQVTNSGDGYFININTAYHTYARDIVRSEAREYLSQFTIAEIASSREAINTELSELLSKTIKDKTPFISRYIGLASVTYPEIITKAQEKAAERREQIEQENAQLEISKVELARKLQEEQMQRKIDVEKAEAEAEVARINAKSMTPAYLKYRSLQVMEKLADSDNKVFIPTEMLDTVAAQIQMTK